MVKDASECAKHREYISKLELILASLETRSNISTFLAGSVYIIISLAITNPRHFIGTQYYILLLFIGAMLLTFSSISYFETSSIAKSVKKEEESDSHLKKIQGLSRYGDILYAIGTFLFILSNVWMLSKFGLIFVLIAALIGFPLFFILVMKR